VKMDEVWGKVGISFSGDAGNDIVQADFGRPFGAGNLESAKLNVLVDLGAGDDTAQVNVWGVLRGSTDAQFILRGGAGNDTLRFSNDNGSHAAAKLNVALDGGDGNDLLSLFFDDNIVGAYTFRLSGGKGDDQVEAVINARSGSTGSLDVVAQGDQGRDRM